MIAVLQSYLQTNTQLNQDGMQRICDAATPLSLQRNELALPEGKICRHKIFVVKGLLRHYSTGENGTERILQFSPENTWTLDVESYDRQVPSQFNIAAVEKSELLLWLKEDFEMLLKELPAFKSFSQAIISRNIYYSRQRLSMLGASPEEKYDDFVRSFPGLLQRLPLHMIASYLGISLKTLTRIRHSQLHR